MHELDKPTSKAIAKINGRVSIERAIIESHEDPAAYLIERRIANAYSLAEHTLHRASRLNSMVNDLSRDNTPLELVGRRLEAACEIGAAELIHRYITRR